MTFFLMVLGIPAAAYRLTRLVTKDTFPPVLWLRDRLAGGWRPLTMREHRDLQILPADKASEVRTMWSVRRSENDDQLIRYVYRWNHVPEWAAELLSCPWCASAYVSAAVTVYGAAFGWYSWPVALIVWFYSWAVAAIVAAKDWA